jgi:hypothetical protein
MKPRTPFSDFHITMQMGGWIYDGNDFHITMQMGGWIYDGNDFHIHFMI